MTGLTDRSHQPPGRGQRSARGPGGHGARLILGPPPGARRWVCWVLVRWPRAGVSRDSGTGEQTRPWGNQRVQVRREPPEGWGQAARWRVRPPPCLVGDGHPGSALCGVGPLLWEVCGEQRADPLLVLLVSARAPSLGPCSQCHLPFWQLACWCDPAPRSQGWTGRWGGTDQPGNRPVKQVLLSLLKS